MAIVQRLVRRGVVPHMRVRFPLVTPRASSESANAADCKSVLLGGNGLDTHLAHFNFILIGEKRHDTIIATPTEEFTT